MIRTKISPKQIKPGADNQVLKTVGGKAVWGEAENTATDRPQDRLFDKVDSMILLKRVSGSRAIDFSFGVPEFFRGRKFKATFKLIYDYIDLNNTDKPRAVTEVFRRDPDGQGGLVDKKLFNKHTNGYHNYFELTEVYERTSSLQLLHIRLRDRDNVSPNQSASRDSCVILETID